MVAKSKTSRIPRQHSLTKLLSHRFDAKVRSRGRAYYEQGRVTLRSLDPEWGLEATVLGGDEYVVWADVRRERRSWTVYAECTCPYTDTYNVCCKHLWAALIAAESDPQNRLAAFGPLPEKIKLCDARTDEESLDDDGFDEAPVEDAALRILTIGPGTSADSEPSFAGSHASGLRPVYTDGRSGGNGRRGWRQVWESLAPEPDGSAPRRPSGLATQIDVKTSPIEPLYILEAEPSVRAKQLTVSLEHRERTKTGRPGRQKKLVIEPALVPRLATDVDRRIALFLLGAPVTEDTYGHYAHYNPYMPRTDRGHMFRLPVAFHDEVLPLLGQTGRFFLRTDPGSDIVTPIRWKEDGAWELFVHVAMSESGASYTMAPRVRCGEEVVRLRDFHFVIESGRPIGILGEDMAPIEAHGCLSWFTEFDSAGPVHLRKKNLRRFIEHLGKLPAVPPIEWPPDVDVTVVHGVEPRPQVKIDAGDGSEPSSANGDPVGLFVDFAYEDAVVDAGAIGSFVADPEKSRLMARDPAAERRFLDRLAELGARLDRYTDALAVPRRRVAEMVQTLLAENWTVFGSDGLYRRPGRFQIDVTSGIDWFDLNGTVEFDGERSASLAELLAAWKKGEGFVRLDDGSFGLLPEEWLTKHGLLLGLGQSQGDSVRFAATQIGLLDAMLAALPEARFDRSVAAARNRLNRFEGIAPQSESREFVGELRTYQREGLGWLRFLDAFGWGGCLADDMGLGKTVQVLALLAERPERKKGRRTKRGRKPAGPSLVVAPKSLMFNWEREARRFAPGLRVAAYVGSNRKELQGSLDDYDVVLTTYDVMRQDIGFLGARSFDRVILDEAQAIKNPKSGRAKAARLLRAQRRLALSGTPIENHLGDLWSILDFLNPGMLGTVGAFKGFVGNGKAARQGNITVGGSETAGQRPAYAGSAGDQNGRVAGNGELVDPRSAQLTVLQRAVRPFVLRRTKTQVAPELPKRGEETVFCDMTPQQAKYYNHLRDAYRLSLLKRVESNGLARSKIQVLEALLRLRQAACHPGLIDKKKASLGSTKLDTTMEMIESIIDEGHKALIYSQFTTMLSFVRRAVEKKGWTYEYLDGKTQDRQTRVDRFQEDPECPLFLLSLKAGGVGLNLTAAEYVFLLDPWWNPAVEAQAIDRTHRIGQERNVIAYRLIAHGTVEEKILELQKSKRALADSVITDENSLIRTLTRDDLTVLLS